MINPLDELSDIYLGQISEADNSPEAIKARVMQHVRAIRYRARKEGDQLNKAYNDYMAGQAGISATEKSMVKERLGLTGGAQHQEGMAYGLSKGTGKPSGAMAAFGKKKTKKTKPTVTIDKPDKLVSLRVSKEGYYSWRHELSEYSGMMPKKNGDAEVKITEKKVKNKVIVNPAQGQAESFAKELGGQLLEACEVFQIFELDDDQIQLLEVKDRKGKGSGTKDACYHKVKSRYSVWPSAYASGALVKCRRVGAANWGNSTKKEDVQWKDIKYKAKSGESTFLSDSDGNIAFEIVDVIAPAVQEAKVDTGRSDYGKASIRNYRRMGPGYTEPGMFDPEGKRGKTIEKRREEHKARRGVKGAKVPAYKVEEVEVVEDYETKKKEEIMGALKKRDLKQKVKEKIAADIIKRKGDVSKSDDRYAYESVEPVDEACWKGYEKKGMKKMFGKMYPNCVKKKTKSEEVEFQEKLDLKKADMGDVVKDFYKSDAPQFKGRSKEKRREMAIAAKLTAERGKLPEEVVTEVSKKTLGSYVKKASTEIGTSAIKGDYKKMQKRHKGVLDASDKLAKEAYSANPAQQAAIAIAKKERKQDLKVAQKKKIKEDSRLTSSNDMQSKMYADKNKSGKKMSDDEIKKEKGGSDFLARIKAAKEKMKNEGSSYGIYKGDGKPKGAMANFGDGKKKKKKSYEEFQQECWKTHKQVGYKKKGGKMVPNCVPKNEEVEITDAKKLSEDDMKGMSVSSGHKRPTKSGAGMTAKGIAAYRRRNPGSKLKGAVTGKVKKGSKAAGRRKSYCARSAGQMKKFPKAAKDPNSRLRQARRRWKC